MSDKTIGGADAAKEVRVIDAGRENVHRLDQAEVVRDAVDRGIVRRREAGNHGGVIHRGQTREHRFQVRGGNLRGAAGVAHQAGQLQLGEVHRVGALARAGADALLAEHVARAGAARVADAMPQPLRPLHHPPPFC